MKLRATSQAERAYPPPTLATLSRTAGASGLKAGAARC
jgi:hypothetical protein